jgi:hypothetical protein
MECRSNYPIKLSKFISRFPNARAPTTKPHCGVLIIPQSQVVDNFIVSVTQTMRPSHDIPVPLGPLVPPRWLHYRLPDI